MGNTKMGPAFEEDASRPVEFCFYPSARLLPAPAIHTLPCVAESSGSDDIGSQVASWWNITKLIIQKSLVCSA